MRFSRLNDKDNKIAKLITDTTVVGAYQLLTKLPKKQSKPRKIPAITVVILLAAMEFIIGFLGLEEGIANFGHFGGIISGIILTYYWKKTTRPKNEDERRKYEFFWE